MVELGSGMGFLLRRFIDDGWTATGIDPWRERSLRMDGHIYFYTDETLSKSAEKVGFSTVDLAHVGRSLTAERFIWNAANVFKSHAFTRTATDVARRIGLANLKFRLNLQDMVRIVTEKPND